MADDFRISGVIDAQNIGFQRAVASTQRGLRDLRRSHVETAASSKVLARETRDLTRELERQARALGVLTLQWRAFRTAMFTAALRTAITGFAGLTASVAALGGALVEAAAAAGALGSAVGVVGASALGGLGQAAIVATLALDKVGKALITTGTDHEKAMAKLTKPARDFVHELRGMQEAFREIKLTAQEGLFPGIVRGLERAKPLLGPLKQTVYDTARAMGYLAERVGDVAGRRANDLERFSQRNIVTLRRLGDSGINVAEAFLDVMRAADPLIGHITRGIVTFSQKIRDAAADARKSGGLTDYFRLVREQWDTWTSTFGNVGGTLFNILRAAVGPAQDLADAVKRTTEKWQEWTGSTRGQAQMTRFFENSNRVLGSMAHFAGAVFTSFARLSMAGGSSAVDFFDTMRTAVVPLLEQLALSFNSNLFPAFLDFIRAFSGLAAAAAPGLEILGQATATLAEGLAAVLRAVTPLVEQAPGISKAFLAFAIGAAVITGWAKLRLGIELAILRLRMFLGLAREVPMAAAGASLMLGRGGVNQGREGVAVTPVIGAPGSGIGGGRGGGGGGGGRGNPFVLGSVGGLGPRRPGGARYDAGRLYSPAAFEGVGQVGRVYPGAPMAFGRYPVRPAFGGDIRRVTGSILTTPYGARATGGQFVREPGLAAGPRTAEYRRFQEQNLIGQRGRLGQAGANIAAFSTTAARGTADGLRAGMRSSAPYLKGGFAMAAVSGLVGGLSSNAKTIAGRARDALSSATFGFVPTTSEVQGDRAQRLQKQIQANRVNFFNQSGTNKAFNLETERGRQNVLRFIESLRKQATISDEAAAALKRLATQQGRTLKGRELQEFGRDVRSVGQETGRWWDWMADKTKVRLSEIRNITRYTGGYIKERLGADTNAGRKALAENFDQAAAAIKRAMKQGTISTRTGTHEIEVLMIRALESYGLSGSQARAKVRGTGGKGSKAGTIQTDVRAPGTGLAPSSARGSLWKIPGQPGPDTVPLNLNGQPVVAAPGEDVAVINRHQRAVLDARLADMGGLRGMFSKVNKRHSRSYAQGGLVTGDTDYLPAVGNALEAMSAATHTPIFVQEGRRTMAEQAARYAAYLAGRGNLAAKPSLSAPHVSGRAADITPGRERFGNVAGDFGLGFTVAIEPWHVELLRLIGKAVKGRGVFGAGDTPTFTIPRVEGPDGLGALGAGVQSALDTVREAAIARGQQLLGGVGGGGGASSAGGQFDKAELAALWIRAGGPEAVANTMAAIALAESSGNPNAQGPVTRYGFRAAGLWQIHPPQPGSFDPLTNARQAIAKYRAGGFDPWEAYTNGNYRQYLQRGGLLARMAQVGIPPRNQPVSFDDTKDAITPASRGGSKKPGAKKKKAGRPFTTGPGLPNLAGIRAKKKRGKPAFHSKYPKLAVDPAWTPKLPDYAAVYANPIAAMQQQLQNLIAEQDLSSEEAIVTLFDSGSYADLSAFWAAHPDLAGRYAGQVDSFDVVNESGYLVQGKWVPGINQHVLELLAQMRLHTGGLDAAGKGGMSGLMRNYLWALAGPEGGVQKLNVGIFRAVSELNQTKATWRMVHGERARAIKQIRKLGGGSTWQQRVADNDERIDALQSYLRDVDDAAVGHRLTDQAKRNKNSARRKIAELRDESADLRREKPKPRGRNAKETKKLSELIDTRNSAARELDHLAGDRDKWGVGGGVAHAISNRIDILTRARDEHQTTARDLGAQDLPAENVEIARLVKEIADWRGTQAILPRLGAASTEDDATMKELLQQQRDDANRRAITAESQLAAFRGFEPMVGARLVGAFQRGGLVTETGLALVHKNETVSPDPQGPFGTQAGVGGASPVTVILSADANLAPLLGQVRAEVRRGAQQVVDETGRRARRIASGPMPGR